MKKRFIFLLLSCLVFLQAKSLAPIYQSPQLKVDSNMVENLTVLVSGDHHLIPLSNIKSNFDNIDIIDRLISDNYEALMMGREIREDSFIIKSSAKQPWAKKLFSKTYLLKKQGEEVYCLLQEQPPKVLINTEFFVLLLSLIFIIFLISANLPDQKKNWLTIALVSILLACFISNLYMNMADALFKSLLETMAAFLLLKIFWNINCPLKWRIAIVYSLAAWRLNGDKMFFVITFIFSCVVMLIFWRIYPRTSKTSSLP